MLAKYRALWLRVPFRHMTAVVIALFLIKEQFPFSSFPMYSNFDTEAEVLFVTDQNDRVLPMLDALGRWSSSAKKAYKKELGKLTAKRKRDAAHANAAERAAAGRIVLDDLCAHEGHLAPYAAATSIRLYRRSFQLVNDKLSDNAPELLAEHSR